MGTAQTILGTFEQLILLAVLQVGDGAYAPSIRQHLQQAMDRRISRGSIYVTLDRLEQRGLLESVAVPAESGRGGRPRRQVTVTGEGIAELQRARGYLDALWSGLDPGLRDPGDAQG